MKTSSAGLALIREHEGFSATPYICPGGKLTIGYGHVILPGEEYYGEIPRAEAETLLRQDVFLAEASVNRLVTVPLTQGQFDALVSFTFNLGAGALARSTLRRVLNEGDYPAAAAEFARWVWGGEAGQKAILPGLVRRRAAERAMFLPREPQRDNAHAFVRRGGEVGKQEKAGVFSSKTAALKFVKGALGGAVIFTALRLGLGREVGWPEVQAFQGVLEVVIVAAFGLYEAVWGAVRWWLEQKSEKPVAPGPDTNFTHKDAP